ncbi:MAG: cardiolipin synthase [Chthoniobacteraceae bacterium]
MPHWSVLYLTSEWAIRFIMLIYVPQRRTAAASRTWLLLIFLLPWPGLALYAMFGRIYVPKKRLELQERASARIHEVQAQIAARVGDTPVLPGHLSHLPLLAARLGDFEPFGGNRIELLADYQGSIERLIGDIGAARGHVHILTYILGTDAVARRFAEALKLAVKRGVTCRLMADAVGSRAGLAAFGEELRAAGVEVVALLPVGIFRHNAARFDLRNHRKIAVIDGTIGHVGSQNLVGPEFVRGFPNEEVVARVTGPVVAQLQAVLLADRFFETDAGIESPELFPEIATCGDSPAQALPSGPGYGRENAEELLVAMLYAARRRVVITTPYFVPGEPFMEALRSSARRGLDVRLIVSQHANQTFTQYAQRSYYDDLLSAGIRVHLHRPRFLHAKHLTVDDSIAMLGSTNMDIRSFALNAEISLIIYDPAVVASLVAIQERYLAESDELDLAAWRARPASQKVLQNIARLADSLL